MKAYLGSDEIRKEKMGTTNVSQLGMVKGVDPTPPPPVISPIDPETIGGLLIYADAARSSVLVNGSGWIYGIQNRGSLGGLFTPYSTQATFANFVKGSGSTRYWEFRANTTNYMSTIYLNYPSGYTPKTTISIAQMVYNTGPYAKARIWNHDTGPLHPKDLSSTTMDGAIPSQFDPAVTPNTALTPYPYTPANTSYSMFAWSSPNYFGTTGSKFQTGLNNSTSATYGGTPGTPLPINHYFINDWNRDTSPGGFTSGVNYHVAHMVYDSVLTEAQINGIYQYFDITRGYSML